MSVWTRGGEGAEGRAGRKVLIALLVAFVWLGFGLLAATQRGYIFAGGTPYHADDPACIKDVARVAVVLAGPLNYLGLDTRMTSHNGGFWYNDSYLCS